MVGEFVGLVVKREGGRGRDTWGHGPDNAGPCWPRAPARGGEVEAFGFFCEGGEVGVARGVFEDQEGRRGRGPSGTERKEEGGRRTVKKGMKEGGIQGVIKLGEAGAELCVIDAGGKVDFVVEVGEGGGFLGEAQSGAARCWRAPMMETFPILTMRKELSGAQGVSTKAWAAKPLPRVKGEREAEEEAEAGGVAEAGAPARGGGQGPMEEKMEAGENCLKGE